MKNQPIPDRMNGSHTATLEQWIQNAFEATKEDPRNYSVYRRLFLPEVDQIERDFKIDVSTDFHTLIDDDSPEYGTCHESVEKSAAEALHTYLATIEQGYGADYSEAYAKFLSRNCGDDNLASQEAFEFIGMGHKNSTDNPAFIEAHAACIRDGKPPEFASRCAGLVVDNGGSFSDAFQAATEFEKAYQLMIKRGHSDLRARMYAEASRCYSQHFSKIYAKCVEKEVTVGRSQQEAERFAEIHASIILDDGEPDEDDPDGWRRELWSRTKAEADYRYRHEFGDKARFIEIFDQIHQRLSDSPKAGSPDWFDEIEATALQQIEAQDAYISAHGNLRGFKIEEETEAEPPAEPTLPKSPSFLNMSDEELNSYSPKSEDDEYDRDKEAEYRDWCAGEDAGLDPMDPDSRHRYEEVCAEEGTAAWDGMDENDRDGWTDNMNKE